MGNNQSGTNEPAKGVGLRERCLLLVVLFVTALSYLTTLRFELVYDDGPQIINNPFIRAWRYVPEYFVSGVWKQVFPLAPGNYYRPLFLLWLRLNYSIFGTKAIAWHMTTVLLHVLVTWLVYTVVMRLTGRFTVAWLTALIFGIHPIHHEVVGWVSGTTESLFAVMFLSSFLAYLLSRKNNKVFWMIVSCIFYALAMFGKETAIVLPVLVFLQACIALGTSAAPEGSQFAERIGPAIKTAACYIPVTALYLILRFRVLSGFGRTITHVSIFTWLLTLPSILFFYVKEWLFPIRLSEFYDVFYQHGLSVAGFILPVLALILLSGAIWIFRKRLGAEAVGSAVIWILIPLLPALDTFVFQAGEIVHDRYFYVPSIGASLLVALVIDRLLAGKPYVFGQPARVVGAALLLAAILGPCTVHEVSFWRNDFALYARAHQIAPLNPTAINNLGAELLNRNEINAGETLLESGAHRFPNDSRFVFNLGRLNYIKKDYSKSEAYTKHSIELNPTEADSFILLGQIQLKQDKTPEAVQSIGHAVELNPYDPTFHTSYGIVLALNKDCVDAIPQFESALALKPGDAISEIQIRRCRATLDSAKTPAASKP